MPVSRKIRQQRKRDSVSRRKRQTGPHNKKKVVAVDATGRSSHRHSVLKFLIIFGVLLAVFYVFIAFSQSYNKRFVPLHHHLIARITGHVLAILGWDVTVIGNSIRSPGFSADIVRGCDAVEAIALYVCAILAFPLPFLKKLIGLTVGALLLLVLNLVRVVSLCMIAAHSRRMFDVMHIDVWQAIFIFFAVLLWILWLLWATRSQAVAQPASG